MECLIVVDGKNDSFNRSYSHPSKNEGWATLLYCLRRRAQRLGHPPVFSLRILPEYPSVPCLCQ